MTNNHQVIKMNISNKVKQFLLNPMNAATFIAVNLLLGTGPIIVPGPFFQAGFILSFVWLIIIILISYSSAMYVVESMEILGELKTLNPDEPIMSEEPLPQDTDNKKKFVFDFVTQYTLLYGTKARLFPLIAISFYLFGVSLSKCILTGNSLSKLFKGIQILEQYWFWLAIFFLSGAAFSFKSIDKTKVLQSVIISVRIISIVLMVGGAIYLIIAQGPKSPIPSNKSSFISNALNFASFQQIFSNLVFTFLFHHSIPGIASHAKGPADIRIFLKRAFIIASTTMILIPFTALFAFGSNLLPATEQLKYYNLDFKDKIDFIYYFVSFYVFLNIAAFSVYIILIRANLFSLIRPQTDSSVLTVSTGATSVTLLAAIITLAFFLKDDIQIALSFTSALFGTAILFILPTLSVIKARNIAGKNISLIQRILPYCILVIGALCGGFSIYQTINRLH